MHAASSPIVCVFATTTLTATLLALTSSVAVSVVGQSVVVKQMIRRRVLDHPNQRSSHHTPTPRGGGIAVLAGILVACALTAPTSDPFWFTVLGFGLIGLAEDLVGIRVLHRLLAQLVLGVTAAVTIVVPSLDQLSPPPGRLAVLLVLILGGLWMAGYTNAFNFMDGLNGFSAANAIVGGVVFASLGVLHDLPALTVTGTALAAASIGFLPWNALRPRIFLGDTGSYGLGALLAALALYALARGVPLGAVIGPFVLYLADTGSTFLTRLRRHECWYQAHRGHVYQRLTDVGWSHLQVTTGCALLSAVISLLCLSGAHSGSGTCRVVAGLETIVLVVAYLRAPSWLRGCTGRSPALHSEASQEESLT